MSKGQVEKLLCTDSPLIKVSKQLKLTKTTGPTLGGQKPKGRKNSTLKPGKGDLKHNKLKNNNNEKVVKYYNK